MKSLHKKPIFYNYSLRKIASALKCSPTTVGKHIKVLQDKGLLTIKDGHLFLLSTNQLKRTTKSPLFCVGVSEHKATQITYLRYALVKRNLYYQKKKFNQKNDTLQLLNGEKSFDHKETGRLLRFSRRFISLRHLESSMDKDFTLSNKKFGSICNRSKTTGYKIQKQFNYLKLLKSTKRIDVICEGYDRRAFFEAGFDGSYFLSGNGTVYKRRSNLLSLSSKKRATEKKVK